MKHLKNNSLRLGALYALLLIILDFTNLHTLFADSTWTLVHDVLLLLTFIALAIAGINYLRKQKQVYSFKSGYFKALKIGGVGVVLYFLISLLLNSFYVQAGESVFELFSAVMPNLLTQAGINIFLLLFFALLPPAYFFIMKNDQGRIKTMTSKQ